MKILILGILLLSSFAFGRVELEDFSTDGCSSWIEGPLLDQDRWKTCCFAHDISYWKGGTEEERQKADEELRECVGKRHDKLMGWTMYTGVRMGGGPGYNTSYRWGYGWNYARPYKPLNPLEKRIVAEKLDKMCFVGEEGQIIYDYMKKNKIPMTYMKMYGRR